MSLAVDIARRRAAGFGLFDPGWEGDYGLGLPPSPDPSWDPPRVIINSDGNPSVWSAQGPSLIAGGLQVLRDIFAPSSTSQAAYNSRAVPAQNPYAYGAAVPPGYGYDSSGRLVKQSLGNITDFITTNPLLVGGVILGVVLLFRQPPGRR